MGENAISSEGHVSPGFRHNNSLRKEDNGNAIVRRKPEHRDTLKLNALDSELN